MKKGVIILILGGLLIPLIQQICGASRFRTSGTGTRAGQFLSHPPGARSWGMGVTGITTTGAAESLFSNPALIGFSPSPNIFMGQSLLISDLSHHFGAYEFKFRKKIPLAVSANYFKGGTLKETDDAGINLGHLSPRDSAVALGTSYAIGPVRMGGSIKLIQSEIDSSASSLTGDLGFLFFLPGKNTRLGFSAQNLFGKLKYIEEKENILKIYRAGMSHQIIRGLVSAVELNLSEEQSPGWAVGMEKSWSWFVLRTGFNQTLARGKEKISGLTWGGGLKWKALRLDYAWVPLGELNQTHHISGSYQFSPPN